MTDIRAAKRVAYVMAAALLVVAGLPFLYQPYADAAQMTSRSIQLSDSGVSGGTITSGVGSGTAVTYRVSFTTSTTVGSMVIDFCRGLDSPIVNDNCTAPTNMAYNSGGASAVAPVTGNIGNWTPDFTVAGQLKLAGNGTNDATPGAQVFDITFMRNPSTLGTFYARMYTYTGTNYNGNSYSSVTSVGNFADYGGIALSTTQTITITARVQESLTFCVSNSDPTTWTTTNECDDPAVTTPAVVLGHGSAGEEVLDATQVDVANIFTQMTTNATNGAVINMRNSTTACAGVTAGGLSADGGTTCAIPPVNGGSNAGASLLDTGLATNQAAFGLFVSNSINGPSGIGSITANTKYHDSAHALADQNAAEALGDPDTWYGMDSTSATAASGGSYASYNGSVVGLFGSTVAACTAPVYRANNLYQFAATAGPSTPAGIYTMNASLIATGTF